jgi:hypothetical protein
MANDGKRKSADLKVFISTRDSTCGDCGENLGRRAWITLVENKGALCLACADLDHLVFLPSGDAALTRRARKHAILNAIVLKWSQTRKQYERQGILVEDHALKQAEQECLADDEARARRRKREAERRAELDHKYVKRFASRVRELYPRCPPEAENAIAEHACRKYSGRVGRSADAKALDPQAVSLAVVAHIRHVETEYDELLIRGFDRYKARALVDSIINAVLSEWSGTSEADGGPPPRHP